MSKPAWLRASTWFTFLAWALVAACVVYWGFALQSGAGVSAAAASPAPVTLTPDATSMGRALGYRPLQTAQGANAAPAPVAPPASSRFALHGVLYQGGGGVALIAVDGKPAKHFRVGAVVDSDLTLQAVAKRSATLGPKDGGAAFTLELPAPSVMVSTSASPALASRPLAPGTPPAPANLGGVVSAQPARALQPGLAPSAVGVQVPGLATQYGTEAAPADANTYRPAARGSALRGLMQGAAGAAAGAAAGGQAETQ